MIQKTLSPPGSTAPLLRSLQGQDGTLLSTVVPELTGTHQFSMVPYNLVGT